MKYFVLEVSFGEELVKEVPIIFPDFMVHRQVAEVIEVHLLRAHNVTKVKPVSAGEIHSTALLNGYGDLFCCCGESETLQLKSRGSVDDRLIHMYSYLHGVVL